jgi:hypothetical protein
MRTYQWIEELLTDLESFSASNRLPRLTSAVVDARKAFRFDVAEAAARRKASPLSVDSDSRVWRDMVPDESSVSGSDTFAR